MEIKNFSVVEKQVSETQRGIIDNNTIELSYSFKKDEKPLVVNFSVFRGKELNNEHPNQVAITGYLDHTGDLQTQMHDKRQKSDRSLIFKIWAICEELLGVEEGE